MCLFEILNEKKYICELQQDMAEFLKQPNAEFWKQVHNLKILIQTNGIEIGRPDSAIKADGLNRFTNLDLTFEVSFKGVNSNQFAWLAESPAELFDFQCRGFEKLWKIRSKSLHVVAELGINHCENIKGFPVLGVRIIDQDGHPINFGDEAQIFKELVLSHIELDKEENAFQEFGQMDKGRARRVVETYDKKTGIAKKCLPSEY